MELPVEAETFVFFFINPLSTYNLSHVKGFSCFKNRRRDESVCSYMWPTWVLVAGYGSEVSFLIICLSLKMMGDNHKCDAVLLESFVNALVK